MGDGNGLARCVVDTSVAGPRVWARGQSNLFGLGLGRAWAEDTLIPAADACPPAADAETAQRLRALLAL